MSTFQFRPTFVYPTELKPTEFIRRVKDWVQSQSDQYEGQFTSEYAMIRIAEKSRHFWSPWLQLELRSTEQGKMVFGRFSPHPSIWSAITFSYMLVIFGNFFGVMFAISQLLSGQTPWAFLTIPVGLIIALGLWLISRIGQKLSLEEMQKIRSDIERLV